MNTQPNLTAFQLWPDIGALFWGLFARRNNVENNKFHSVQIKNCNWSNWVTPAVRRRQSKKDIYLKWLKGQNWITNNNSNVFLLVQGRRNREQQSHKKYWIHYKINGNSCFSIIVDRISILLLCYAVSINFKTSLCNMETFNRNRWSIIHWKIGSW